MKLRLLNVAAILLATILLTIAANAATFTYDFESLSLGNLNPQDNWAQTLTPGQPFVVTSGLGTNTSQVVGTAGSTTSNFFGRENDGNFSFGSLTGVTQLTLGFDLRYVEGGNGGINNQALFQLTHDPGLVTQSQSPAFGLNGNNLIVGPSSGGSGTGMPTGLDFNDWFSLRLEIDLTANAGEGSGSLFYKNLTDGDAGFTAVTGRQNLNLLLVTNGNDPLLWDTMHLRTGFYEGNKIDNLTIETVPEPSRALLLLFGASIVVARRHRSA